MIEQLTHWCEARRQEAVKDVLCRLQGKLSDADREATEQAFRRFQDEFLHGPISAITEETRAGPASGYTLAEALRKLFRLADVALPGSGVGGVARWGRRPVERPRLPA